MSGRAAYLAEITDWARGGQKGRAPSPLPHGLTLGDFTADEYALAVDAGDPRPPNVSNWIWWDGTLQNLLLWHECIRAANSGGEFFTTDEVKAAKAAYLQRVSKAVAK